MAKGDLATAINDLGALSVRLEQLGQGKEEFNLNDLRNLLHNSVAATLKLALAVWDGAGCLGGAET
jgi:hypothetical protein